MTTLAGLQIDPNVKEADGEFIILPAGKYKAVLVADELKDTKIKPGETKSTGKRLVLKLQVIEGQFAQELLEDGLNIINPSAQSQAIGQGTLKRICNVCSVPFPPQDTAGLMGKPMVVTVGVEDFKSNTSGKMLKGNKIKKYEPADTLIQPQPQANAQAEPQAAGNW